jgi:hypothetical protein
VRSSPADAWHKEHKTINKQTANTHEDPRSHQVHRAAVQPALRNPALRSTVLDGALPALGATLQELWIESTACQTVIEAMTN